MSYVDEVLARVKAKNASEPEFLQAVEEGHAYGVVAFKFHNHGGAALRLAGGVVGRKGGGAHAQAGEQGRCGKKTKSFHAISLG